nr:MAG TPA: hypothetical protein [Caudoviricetes sp.]
MSQKPPKPTKIAPLRAFFYAMKQPLKPIEKPYKAPRI